MPTTAFLFPGQGSQTVGMGRDLFDRFEGVKRLFAEAEAITGLPLARLCFEGPLAELTRTVNLQPALTAVNLAFLLPVAEQGLVPDFCAGHSLGEFSALHAAGVLSREETFRLVMKRGELMDREAARHPGAMCAVIGLAEAALPPLVAAAGREGPLAVANYNGPGQVVLTGAPGPIQTAARLVRENGGRAVPLKVAGAWHSELIRAARAPLADAIRTVSFHPPRSRMVLNVTGEAATDSRAIRDAMERQVTSPVRWHESMQALIREGVDLFVELGPGKVLSGLLRKILPENYPCKILNINDMNNLETFLREIT